MCRKHALTLQVHTAHILSAHASLDEKGKALQDVKEQKNRCVLSTKLEIKINVFTPSNSRLESERARLLNCLREVSCILRIELIPFFTIGVTIRSTRIVTRWAVDPSFKEMILNCGLG